MMRIDDSSEFKRLVHAGAIRFAGNQRLKIYGTLRCASGKRMKKDNRVFFASVEDAASSGFRPCGKCLPNEYRLWKAGMNAIHECNSARSGLRLNPNATNFES